MLLFQSAPAGCGADPLLEQLWGAAPQLLPSFGLNVGKTLMVAHKAFPAPFSARGGEGGSGDSSVHIPSRLRPRLYKVLQTCTPWSGAHRLVGI